MTPPPVLIGVAWPYANGELHIGHYAGAMLPPDILARFLRLRGHRVLMVSGSDTHGTPITIRAEDEGITPMDVIDRYHPLIVDGYLRLGLTYDLYTHTETEQHWKTTQAMFLRHHERGYITKATQRLLYDPKLPGFLPDRYVEGTCPRCGYDQARGDQCDNCGSIFDATELKNPRSKRTGNTELEIRDTEHFFLELGKLNDALLAWINDGKEHWRTNVLNYTRAQLEERSLRGRPITRDITWGIAIPLPGYDDKRIYVWYDAVIGYLSAAQEWATLTGQPEAWREFWDAKVAPHARLYNFIGKDNIPFHSIIWPAMLLGHGDLNLPYDVPANEYLNMKGRKFSKSRGNLIVMRDVLDRYQPDAWRYALTAMAPEGNDADFTWEEFLDRVNGELIANWGNLVNRVAAFAYKRFEGRVPTPGALDAVDETLLKEVKEGFESVAALYDGVKLKAASIELRRLSQKVNQYITDKAPFTLIKTDVAAAATVTWCALQAIAWLNTMWSPSLAFSTQQVHEMLGFDGSIAGRQYTETVKDARGEHLVLRYDHSTATGAWAPMALPPGQAMREPAALFVKLDPSIIEKEAGASEGLPS